MGLSSCDTHHSPLMGFAGAQPVLHTPPYPEPGMPVLIKICGLTTTVAVDAALEAGADMVGFVFFGPSPRHIGFEAVRLLGDRVGGRARKVAVSVDGTDEVMKKCGAGLKPD